jgi:hypothetical protein
VHRVLEAVVADAMQHNIHVQCSCTRIRPVQLQAASLSPAPLLQCHHCCVTLAGVVLGTEKDR